MEEVRTSRVAGLRLSSVDVTFQVTDHVGFSSDGDRADDAVVVSPEPPRALTTRKEDIHHLQTLAPPADLQREVHSPGRSSGCSSGVCRAGGRCTSSDLDRSRSRTETGGGGGGR